MDKLYYLMPFTTRIFTSGACDNTQRKPRGYLQSSTWVKKKCQALKRSYAPKVFPETDAKAKFSLLQRSVLHSKVIRFHEKAFLIALQGGKRGRTPYEQKVKGGGGQASRFDTFYPKEIHKRSVLQHPRKTAGLPPKQSPRRG